jgi:hypothetical protein
MRQVEFIADEEGDWAFHCHKSHHTMNAMGHGVPTMIGVDHREVVRRITRVIPDYMVMGERGMADMTEMQMPLPDNTAPMMAGEGPFGPVGMGGMFSVLKVRRGQKRGDYGDPGWFAHPPGTVAREVGAAMAGGAAPSAAASPAPSTVPSPVPAPATSSGTGAMPVHRHGDAPRREVEVQIRKPAGGHAGH